MTKTPQEALEERLKDPEFTRLFGAAQTRGNIAALLTACKIADGLSRKQMADRLGVSPRRYSAIINGDANPRISEIGALFAALGLRVRFSVEPLVGRR